MLEESVEGFVARWRAHAARGTAFARLEGSPLLEVALGETVVQLFERTGPYDAPAGPVRLVVHGVATRWSLDGSEGPSLAALGPARLRVSGRVVERDADVVVVDAGVPVVVGLMPADDGPSLPEAGDWITCETLAPAQAFVIREPVRRAVASPDDQV